ncbi:MAG: glycosyltransferase family 4 protein [Pseudomonadota bacterium]
MKILVIHNRYQTRGGEDAVVEAEMELLRDHGHEVQTLLVNNDGIDSLWTKLGAALSATYSRKGVRAVQGAIRRGRPDIMHVHNFFPQLSPFVFSAAKRLGVSTVHTLHNFRLLCPSASLYVDGRVDESSLRGSAFGMLRKRAYRGSITGTSAVAFMVDFHKRRGTWNRDVDAFVCLTEFGKQKFIEGGLPESRLYTKPNFLSSGSVDPYDRAKRHGALFVGRLTREKGVDTLLKAWQNIDYPLTVAGGGAAIGDSDCANVTFLGECSRAKIESLMRSSAFLVMPSEWYEGFPVTLLEAYSRGLPVVASDIGSLTELVQDGVTGIKFTPGSPAGLQAAVQKLLALDDERIAAMSRVVSALVRNKYSPESNYSQLMAIYAASLRSTTGQTQEAMAPTQTPHA